MREEMIEGMRRGKSEWQPSHFPPKPQLAVASPGPCPLCTSPVIIVFPVIVVIFVIIVIIVIIVSIVIFVIIVIFVRIVIIFIINFDNCHDQF